MSKTNNKNENKSIGLFDLSGQLAFYGAYHNQSVFVFLSFKFFSCYILFLFYLFFNYFIYLFIFNFKIIFFINYFIEFLNIIF